MTACEWCGEEVEHADHAPALCPDCFEAIPAGGPAVTLICDACGSYDLRITAQSYDGPRAFEGYECGHCGASGTLTHDDVTGTTLTGCLGSDGR